MADESPYTIEILQGRLVDQLKREQVSSSEDWKRIHSGYGFDTDRPLKYSGILRRERYETQIRALHGACYPGEQDPDDSLDEVFQQITFLHEEEDCTWLLLWLPGSTSWHHTPARLAAMLVSVEYHDSTYAFGYGVLPSFRGMGMGKRLMYELEKRTLSAGRPGRISSTVDAKQPRLLAYYRRQGGHIQSSGVTSSNACPLPSVRIIKEFDEGEAQAGIDSAHVAILSGMAKRDMRQKVVSWAAVAASIALSSALLWLFSSRKYSRKHLT